MAMQTEQSAKKRLFLLDAYALIFRGYYALIKNPRVNSKGLDTSAIMGFVNALFDVINKEKPELLGVCFDKGGSVERTELFSEYKANRHETPEAIKIAVPYIEKILNGLKIPVVVKEGYEADDLIGTLAKKAEKEDFTVYMVTPDKDFGQLVSDNVFMYRPGKGGSGPEVWGVPQIQERFGVKRPEQVIDYLGMMGDASDNIPGLPGVGDKTAKKLLEEFDSLENLLENTHLLKGKMKEKIEANAELGKLSKVLATIKIDCEIDFDPNAFVLEKPELSSVYEIFDELEFRRAKTTLTKLFSDANENESIASDNTAASNTPGEGQFSLFDGPLEKQDNGRLDAKKTTHLYQCVNDPVLFEYFLNELGKQKEVSFDTETTSLNPLEAELVGISFSWSAHKAYYLHLEDQEIETSIWLEKLTPFFENTAVLKIGQNLKYDIKVLKKYDIEVKGPLFDTMLAHYLINPDMRHNMTVLSETYLNYSPIEITQLIGKKGKGQKSMRDVSLTQLTEYAAEDADITFQLYALFKNELKSANLHQLFNEVEIPLLNVLAAMELEGVNLDTSYLEGLNLELTSDIDNLEQAIYQKAGREFNIASPKQLGVVLFEDLKLVDKPKKTKTGQYATSEDILVELAKSHEIASNILEYRGLAKLKSTYVEALPQQLNLGTKRIHTEYMQTVAATGRLSSNNPNLQNIPIRTERGKAVRKAFVPKDENYVLLAADYSQIELRIIAALAKEENMIKAFQNDFDIHADTASKVFNVPIEEVSRTQRSQAKTVNFGIIYGVSAFGLSNQTDLSRKEAKALIDTYYETYPKLRAYMQNQVNSARENGYVETILGRRRYLKDINSRNAIVRGAAERNAVNAPIQGSAADIIKLAMIEIHEKLRSNNLKSKMLLQVHDELVFDAHKDELEELQKLIVNAMENAYAFEVPLKVDVGLGSDWLEAH